jgi:hypothetical protein
MLSFLLICFVIISKHSVNCWLSLFCDVKLLSFVADFPQIQLAVYRIMFGLYSLLNGLLIISLKVQYVRKVVVHLKMCWKWFPRACIQAWTRLIPVGNTFCRSAFGMSLCTFKRCWKWCSLASIQIPNLCTITYVHSDFPNALYFQLLGFLWPGSSVGLATGYGLDDPGIECRWGEIFRICPDWPWGPPSLLYNGYRVFPGGRKRPGPNADPSPPSSVRFKNRVQLYLYSP